MDVPLQQEEDEDEKDDDGSFNPCFNGCSSSTYTYSNPNQRFCGVSILVLMDVPLQHGSCFGA